MRCRNTGACVQDVSFLLRALQVAYQHEESIYEDEADKKVVQPILDPYVEGQCVDPEWTDLGQCAGTHKALYARMKWDQHPQPTPF